MASPPREASGLTPPGSVPSTPTTGATSFPKSLIKVLLLENIATTAVDLFRAEGYQIETLRGALSAEALAERIADVHILGIRSKTHITAAHFAAARRLLAVGCFCIGTNQVDADAAKVAGVPVFNAPFANTRSVAELVICEVIALSRQLFDRSAEVHRGVWKKAADGCHEVRGKTLSIIGYGHIGSQVGVLAEAMGMRVVFYDVVSKLPMGNNTPLDSLPAALAAGDFVTLHVPLSPDTEGMIGAAELAQMRRGACLLNISRGTVVDIDALAAALRSGHVGGAAIDVYPSEPEGNGAGFVTPLQGIPNVILTPHVGGSTEEAQAAIGKEVATTLVRFVNTGATTGSVNFPVVDLPAVVGSHRILHIHRNVPGVIRDVAQLVSDLGINITRQVLATDPVVGYLVMDVDMELSETLRRKVQALRATIRVRILF